MFPVMLVLAAVAAFLYFVVYRGGWLDAGEPLAGSSVEEDGTRDLVFDPEYRSLDMNVFNHDAQNY